LHNASRRFKFAKYYTPKGRDINHVGIAPDINVELTEAQQKALVQNHTLATLADPQYAIAVADLSKLIQSGANHVSLQRSK
jgi:carboxyl-terminal processing protease